jgi:hypothetical protein
MFFRALRAFIDRSFQPRQLCFGKDSPLAAWQIAQAQIPNSNADQALHIVTDGVKHSANLLIESLAEDNSKARRTHPV